MQERRAGHGFFSRRGFIKVLAAGGAAWSSGCAERGPSEAARHPPAGTTSFITPNHAFFLVAVDPTFRPPFGLADVGNRWALQLQGMGAERRKVAYGLLDERARREVLFTLECASNPAGGELIGNARWRVVPLREILAPLMSDEVGSVMFEGLDGYYSSIAVERAMDDYAFLALDMNGRPLPARHGFPARVLLPGVYGMKQPRWLHRISLLRAGDTTSYWEKRGWPATPVGINSRVDPMGAVPSGAPADLGGIAYGGGHGIRAVEVSFDGGRHWQLCDLVHGTTPHVWSVWRYRWDRPTPGRHALEVRAIDGEGRVQTGRRTGSGLVGHHMAQIHVS